MLSVKKIRDTRALESGKGATGPTGATGPVAPVAPPVQTPAPQQKSSKKKTPAAPGTGGGAPADGGGGGQQPAPQPEPQTPAEPPAQPAQPPPAGGGGTRRSRWCRWCRARGRTGPVGAPRQGGARSPRAHGATFAAMPNHTKVNLKEIEDQAPSGGLSPGLKAHFARVPLGLEKSGITYFRIARASASPSATSTASRKRST